MKDVNWPKPWARQREELYLPTTGVSVVQGAAGSGKTLMALYRAKYLSDPSFAHSGPTLLLTYSRPLAKYLGTMAGSSINVSTYHKLLYDVLPPRSGVNIERTRGLSICVDPERTELIKMAVDKVCSAKANIPDFWEMKDFYIDEINWMFRMGIRSLDDYLAQDLKRDDERFARIQHETMYEIFDVYLQELEQAPYDYEFEQMPYVWANSSYCKTSLAPYKHIIIDEGQDFPPVFVRAIAENLKNGGSLTFFVDNTQQVFGPRICIETSYFKDAKVWSLYENYRSTIEIYNLSRAISDKIAALGQRREVLRAEPPALHGPRPQLIKVFDDQTRDKLIAKLGENDFSKITCAFLVSTNEDMARIKALIPKAVNAKNHLERHFTLTPDVYTCTYQSAKGLEFDCVIMPFADPPKHVAMSTATKSSTDKDNTIKALKALYVAVSRARYKVIILFEDLLSDLLPDNQSLYELNADAKQYLIEGPVNEVIEII